MLRTAYSRSLEHNKFGVEERYKLDGFVLYDTAVIKRCCVVATHGRWLTDHLLRQIRMRHTCVNKAWEVVIK